MEFKFSAKSFVWNQQHLLCITAGWQKWGNRKYLIVFAFLLYLWWADRDRAGNAPSSPARKRYAALLDSLFSKNIFFQNLHLPDKLLTFDVSNVKQSYANFIWGQRHKENMGGRPG